MIILPVIHCYTIHILASYLNLALSFFLTCVHILYIYVLLLIMNIMIAFNYLYCILCFCFCDADIFSVAWHEAYRNAD